MLLGADWIIIKDWLEPKTKWSSEIPDTHGTTKDMWNIQKFWATSIVYTLGSRYQYSTDNKTPTVWFTLLTKFIRKYLVNGTLLGHYIRTDEDA